MNPGIIYGVAHCDQDAADDCGMPQSNCGMNKRLALGILDSQIRVLPHCERPCSTQWDEGFVMSPSVSELLRVSYGTNILVQDAALKILSLASHGRMSPQRFWRLLMAKGFSTPESICYRPSGVDYREGIEVITQLPRPFHDMGFEDILKLEEVGDVASIQQMLVHKGMFWVWMNPDWYVKRCSMLIIPRHLTSPCTVFPPPCRRAQLTPFSLMRQLQRRHGL